MTGTAPHDAIYTADVALLSSDGRILLIQRGDWPPFPGHWALPGGHVDPGETSVAAGARELREETGIHLPPEALREVGRYGAPGRDPRGRYITDVFSATVPTPLPPTAGDDAAEAHWWPLEGWPRPLGFDHQRIIDDLLSSMA